MYQLKDSDAEYFEQFSTVRPRDFSLELMRALLHLKGGSVYHKSVVICIKPGEAWALGRTGGSRGASVERMGDEIFNSYLDAQAALFKLRWVERTGRPFPERETVEGRCDV